MIFCIHKIHIVYYIGKVWKQLILSKREPNIVKLYGFHTLMTDANAIGHN